MSSIPLAHDSKCMCMGIVINSNQNLLFKTFKYCEKEVKHFIRDICSLGNGVLWGNSVNLFQSNWY